MIENLWGNLVTPVIRTPKSILKEQADQLTKMTSGVLIGVVRDTRSNPFIHEIRPNRTQNLVYELLIRVPAINDYTYSVLSIEHSIDLYPVTIKCGRPDVDVECPDEQIFIDQLRSILSSEEIGTILTRLISQAQ